MEMEPVVDRLAGEYGGRIEFMVYKDVNARADISKYAQRQGVRAVPTMVLVSGSGVELQRFVGGKSEADLRTAFEEVLP